MMAQNTQTTQDKRNYLKRKIWMQQFFVYKYLIYSNKCPGVLQF